jgi:hypothetical protein
VSLVQVGRGLMIAGTVKLSSPDHIALIAFGLFNVSVPQTELPETWRFEESVWVDGRGGSVEGEILFEVRQYGLWKGTR